MNESNMTDLNIKEKLDIRFDYKKFKAKRLKRFDGQPLSEELLQELQDILSNAVVYGIKK